MSFYLVLARKYRPSTFREVVGQDHVVKTLQNSIKAGRVAHAFLFSGVRGVGKTTIARLLAKTLNCLHRKPDETDCCNQCASCREITAGISVDVQEIDGASNTSVDNIREINENIKYPPVSSPFKIIIIDEVHMISTSAFNALLKTLEEPPPHAKFVFATTESRKVPATIHSRCQHFHFRMIAQRDIVEGMKHILSQEGIEAEPEALALVAREAQGSFRDALSLLDQVISFGRGKITVGDVTEILGITGRDVLPKFIAAVLERNAVEALRIAHCLSQEGYDPEQFILDLIHYVRDLMVAKTVSAPMRPDGLLDVPTSELEEIETLAAKTSVEELQNLFFLLTRSEGEIRRSTTPWIALEMAVLRMAWAPEIVNLTDLLRRINETLPRVRQTPMGKEGASTEHGHAAKRDPVRLSPVPPAPQKPIQGETASSGTPTGERFTITKITPLPAGTPDEVWSQIKARLAEARQDSLLGIMDHGHLIAFGPLEVEIGFTRKIYQSQFEERLQSRPEIKAIFEEFFGDAQLKVLTLSGKTSLAETKPYEPSADGQTDLDRALRQEAQDNPIVKKVLSEFEDSAIDEIKILSSKA